jgi:hypothetical protein
MGIEEYDLDRAWHGDRADQRVLLAPRDSGRHALVRGADLHGSGYKEALGSSLLRPKRGKKKSTGES